MTLKHIVAFDLFVPHIHRSTVHSEACCSCDGVGRFRHLSGDELGKCAANGFEFYQVPIFARDQSRVLSGVFPYDSRIVGIADTDE